MTPHDFCYWLQGALEVHDPEGLTPAQLVVVKQHLALVFKYESGPKPKTVLPDELRRRFTDPDRERIC